MVVAEQLVELQCWVCARAFMAPSAGSKRTNRIGPRPEHDDCWSARNKIARTIRTIREQVAESTCRYCKNPRELGSKYCANHHYRREPCAHPGCNGRVVRNEGQGGQPRHCEKHRAGKRAPQRQTEGAVSHGS